LASGKLNDRSEKFEPLSNARSQKVFSIFENIKNLFHGRSRGGMRQNRFVPNIEQLEERWVPAVPIIVNTIANDGEGSLRWAIQRAVADDVILFEIGKGVQRIEPQSNLPAITVRLTIIGSPKNAKDLDEGKTYERQYIQISGAQDKDRKKRGRSQSCSAHYLRS
jgi:hypothetical protein